MVRKLTDEEFKTEIFKLVKDEYSFIDTYKNNKTLMSVTHNKKNCNHTYKVRPSNFKLGYRCPNCFGTGKKLDNESIQLELDIKHKKQFTLISDYKNRNSKLDILHKDCNQVIHTTYGDTKYKRFICDCQVIKKNVDRFKNQIQSEFDLISDYYNSKTLVTVRHNKCKQEYKITPDKLLQSKKCKECSSPLVLNNNIDNLDYIYTEVNKVAGKQYFLIDIKRKEKTNILELYHHKCKQTFTIELQDFMNNQTCKCCNSKMRAKIDMKKKDKKEILKKIQDLLGSEYSMTSDFIGIRSPITLQHNTATCNHSYEINPRNLKPGRAKCPSCSGQLKTNKHFISEVKELVGEEYTFLGTYINSREKIEFKHNICNNTYLVSPNKFLSGKRCPHCNNSKGELAIRDLLDKKNINYIREYKFEHCRNFLPLRFDFAVFDNRGNISCLIEYDGQQHFEPVAFNGDIKTAEELHKKTKHNDQIKNDFCLKQNIPLLRIKYTDFENIEYILIDFIHSLKTNDAA